MNHGEPRIRILLLGDAGQVHLARWAGYLTAAGYRVLTASLEADDRMPGARHRIRVPALLPSFLRYPLAVPAVRRLVRDFAPHLVNAHFLPNYGVIAALAGFSPWVLSTWGSDIMLLPERSAFHLLRTRRVIQSATFVTSDAEVMSRRLVELGADPGRIVTFPYGVDRSLFHPGPAREEGDGPRILSNRKLEAVYDVSTVVSAFERIRDRFEAARMTVAGEGSQAARLRAQAGASPHPESIEFIGNLPHTEMPGLLRKHDLYVSMAVSDTTSVSLLEAMACGLLPVVSDIPANREWIDPGRNGLLVPVGDAVALESAVAEAWSDTGLRAAARELNASVIERRADWFDNMAAVRELFERLVARTPGHDAA
ncbi:MAG: glycosyltransferase [Candidatus Krumholzibacteriia bacterium]